MKRRDFLKTTLLVASGSGLWSWRIGAAQAPGFNFEPAREIIPAPADLGDWAEFRRHLADWRAAKRRELNYSDALYRRPEFAWAARNFSCCFLMLCDETFYQARTGRYRVKEFLRRETREFGGYDSVVLWHAYPRLGLDQRNQFDFYRDMPGGLAGLRRVTRQFHQQGLRVFLDYNPWDTGTRREDKTDLAALCEIVRALDADGIFLDTMDRGAAEFRGLLDRVRPGVVLEGEIALPLDRVQDHHLSWAQWLADSPVPGVLRNKWFERRHLQHQIKRWNLDHTGELHSAWINGSGMLVWENVFGSWVGWSERDKSILRQMLPIQRRYAALFSGEGWTPLVPTLARGLYASLWEDRRVRLWTLVNRSPETAVGELLAISVAPGERVFDLVNGRAPAVQASPAREHELVITGSIAARGIGCYVAGHPHALGKDFAGFLQTQRQLAARASLDSGYPARVTRLKPPPRARPRERVPEGMVEIPGGTVRLRLEMRERECGFYESSPPGGPRFEDAYNFNTRTFERSATLARFAMDLTPVTNAQFAEFLRAAKYQPRHRAHFLKHWLHDLPPFGQAEHPVVYVDLEDARAYARWAGKRLPTEEEWQHAAQGPDALKYPWGNEMLPDRCNGGQSTSTTPVKQFPAGRSPFGVWDLCGNVWEWTESERSDGRTRFCVLKGGSFYTAIRSGWYMDGGPRPNAFSEKCLLMWAGLDRCGTVGFRCVADLA